MTTIHGKSHQVIKFFRQHPAALSVYWLYCSRVNSENVAWPSADGLARDTGWTKKSCLSARKWLIEHGALVQVKKYVRPSWRMLDKAEQKPLVNLDKAVYCRPTGIITIDGQTYPLLYVPQTETSDIENYEDTPDSASHPPSMGVDMQPDTPELDSSSTELSTSKEQKTLAPLENGAVTPEVEKPKKERSPAQQANDKLVEALGVAYGTEASNGEYGNYLRIAKQLTKDITPEEFGDFVAFVRNMAERDKWTLTINSLVSGKVCPMSQFIKAGRPKAADTTPDFAKGINWI